MKYFVALCVVFAIAASKPAPGERSAEFMEAHETCSKTTGVTEDVEFSGEFLEDPNAKKHIQCIVTTMKIMDDAGKINEDVLTDHLSKYLGDESKAAALVTKCAVEQDTPENTAELMVQCLFEAKKELDSE